MSFEAITSIAAAEEEAKNAVAKAHEKAKEMIAKAEADGKASVEEAIARAEKELAEFKTETEKNTELEIKKFTESVKIENEAMRKLAESKLDKAATLVVERIVSD